MNLQLTHEFKQQLRNALAGIGTITPPPNHPPGAIAIGFDAIRVTRSATGRTTVELRRDGKTRAYFEANTLPYDELTVTGLVGTFALNLTV